jgi:hypothetical protein
VVGLALKEMLTSAKLAFALCPHRDGADIRDVSVQL